MIYMKNLRKKYFILEKLKENLERKELNNDNIDRILKDNKISLTNFYSFFPKKLYAGSALWPNIIGTPYFLFSSKCPDIKSA